MTSQGRSYVVGETWQPTCHKQVIPADLRSLLRLGVIKSDECRRKKNHKGRCVGLWYVWDSAKVVEIRKALNK
jgi:hypothetical protein